MFFVVFRTPDSCRGQKILFFYLATLKTWLSVFNRVKKSHDRIHLKGPIHSVTIYTSKGVTKRRFELYASPTGCQPTYLFSRSFTKISFESPFRGECGGQRLQIKGYKYLINGQGWEPCGVKEVSKLLQASYHNHKIVNYTPNG